MKKHVTWSVIAVLGITSSVMANVIYPANNGFELLDLGGASITYLQGTNTTASPGWTLRAGGSSYVGVTPNGWAGINNIANGNYGGTTSTDGQAMMIIAGDGKYGAAATANSAYISTSFTLEQAGDATVQFDYRVRQYASEIKAYIVASDNTVYDMGGIEQQTTDFVTFVSPEAQSLAAGTYTLYLVGAVQNEWYDGFVDNVQINVEFFKKISLVMYTAAP